MKSNEIHTTCVHAGTNTQVGNTGLNTAIYPSSSFRHYPGGTVLYPRYYNTPNAVSVAAKIAALEYAETGLVLGSGMAAISTSLMGLLKAGDHAIFQEDLYGGTYYFVTHMLPQMGISYTFVRQMDEPNLTKALQPNTKLVYIETPSNPLLKVVSMETVAKFAKKNGLVSLIDNTFASPIVQNPIKWGIDVVMHSGTKYLGGHSDLTFGAVVCSEKLMGSIRTAAINFGGVLDSHACYMAERSMKTLALRVERQNHNAHALATWLSTHPKIDAVYYPGLPTHEHYQISQKQMNNGMFGAMLSFEIKGAGTPQVMTFLEKLNMITPAVSLGGVETILTVPVFTSHAKLSEQERKEAGIRENLIRLSVGIEGVADLKAELDHALN